MRKNSITHSSQYKLYKACLDNSKVWLLRIKKEYPQIIQEAEYRYFYYLRVLVGLEGYKYYQKEEKSFFDSQVKDMHFLKNNFLSKGQKIYIYALYYRNRLLVQIIDKVSKVRKYLSVKK